MCAVSGFRRLRDGSRTLCRIRNAVPSIGQVLSHRISRMASVEYFVTLEFPLSLSSQYLPPDSTITPPPLELVVVSPSNNTSRYEKKVGEYRVSREEYCKAVEMGQLTMTFDPGKPGIELPPLVHHYNWFFWSAWFGFSGACFFCSYVIGWRIALFHNETWCGMVEYILLPVWILPATVLCSYYRWCNTHHQLAVPFDSFLPLETLPIESDFEE